eukprot:3191769-Alexandrium_andersonii.AAC.1
MPRSDEGDKTPKRDRVSWEDREERRQTARSGGTRDSREGREERRHHRLGGAPTALQRRGAAARWSRVVGSCHKNT